MNKPAIHVIAEAGTNHNGCVTTARQLIDVAKAAGADSVKFQMIWPEGLYLPRFYENGGYRESEVFAQRQATALSAHAFRQLAGYCGEAGIAFSSSIFDRAGIALLDELDVDYIKIASCDLNNSPLIRAAAETGRRIVLSTGMSTLDEIETAVQTVQATGNDRLVLMHCVSIYPASTAAMNLGFIDTLRETFGVPVGLSDHTENGLAAAVAVGKGVTWIEKHITLDRTSPGFDHAYAMEPDGFTRFMQDVRAAEAACANPPGKVSPTEAAIRQRARRALYAARDIAAGETLEEADVLVVRPEGPLCPNDLPRVIGRVARRAIHQYEALRWDAIASSTATRESQVAGAPS